MTTKKRDKNVQHIERLIKQDPGGRLFASMAENGDLLESASHLLLSQRVLLITGFCVLDAMMGETDGPPGALVMGHALRLLGKEVAYVTDKFSFNILQQGMRKYPLTSHSPIFTVTKDRTASESVTLLTAYKPNHVVSIERPGKASDGNSYSVRGEKLNHVIPQLDIFFEPPFNRQYATTGIGDGGNEMGLGGLHEKISSAIPKGNLIASATKADYVIPAGISNWAGYAVAATLSLLAGKPLLPPFDTERAVVAAMVKAGAVDGCTKIQEMSVDGIDFNLYLQVIDRITQIVETYLALPKLTDEIETDLKSDGSYHSTFPESQNCQDLRSPILDRKS